jgi:hypothetical protein
MTILCIKQQVVINKSEATFSYKPLFSLGDLGILAPPNKKLAVTCLVSNQTDILMS